MTAEELLLKYPCVKLGLDDYYGKQTVLNAINEAIFIYSSPITVAIYSDTTTDGISNWINNLSNVSYDSIRLKCDYCENSPSGLIFTAMVRCGT